MGTKDGAQKPVQEPPKTESLPKGAVELEKGVYVMREVRSAFAALSAAKQTKPEKR